MNPHRVANLLRELADELDSGGAPAKPAAPAASRPKRRTRRRRAVQVPDDVSEVDVQRAISIARRRGVPVA